MMYITFLIIGLLVGWVASLALERRGFGPVGDVWVGVLGAFVGGLFGSIWVATESSILSQVLLSFVGTLIALGVAALVRNDRPIIHV